MENTQTQNPTPAETPLLTWNAPSAPAHNRSHRWYVIGGGFILAVSAYGILTGAWTLAVVMLLCGAMYVLLHDHTPPLKSISIFDHGILYQDAYIRFEDVSGFWFVFAGDYTELHVERKDPKASAIVIHTEPVGAPQIRSVLGAHIPELTDKRQNILDAIIRICKL